MGQLKSAGFQTIITSRVTEAISKLSTRIDLILLDLDLPDEDGLAFVRRAGGYLPLMVVTKSDNAMEGVVGLELGADDFVTKPFDFRILLARAKALLRRHGRLTSNQSKLNLGGGLDLDISRRIVVSKDGNEICVTCAEFEILCALATHAGRILSRDQLIDRLHPDAPGPYDRAIDAHISRLRRKLRRDSSLPQLIVAVREQGYRLTV